ncbi:MAG: type II toxin-antitoxin system prevent-host-death family antitoxin [Thermodesulfobacteriota bacterium]
MKTTSRALRQNLSTALARAERGEEVIVTRRGKPVAKIVPVTTRQEHAATRDRERYPLRGSVLFIADDFDAPLEDLWEAMSE